MSGPTRCCERREQGASDPNSAAKLSKMAANNLLESHLINLKIISKVPAETKVSVADGTVVKDCETALQPVIRFIKGDSRRRTVEVITNIINSTIDSAENMCESVYLKVGDTKEANAYEYGRFKQIYEDLRSISFALNESTRGIRNISNTYKTDDIVVSNMDRLLERIQAEVDKIQGLLLRYDDAYKSLGVTPGTTPETNET